MKDGNTRGKIKGTKEKRYLWWMRGQQKYLKTSHKSTFINLHIPLSQPLI
jgi:hypothetical protein